MKEELKRSNQEKLSDSQDATSLQESQDGNMLSNLQDGQQTSLFGQQAFHANHSAYQEKEEGLRTSDTSGQYSKILSKSADLGSFLVSRLAQKAVENGSALYKVKCRKWDMSALPPIWGLRASGLRISDKDFIGWPTCTTKDKTPSQEAIQKWIAGDRGKHGLDLDAVAQMAGWGTPNAMDHMKSVGLEKRKEKGGCANIKDQVCLIKGWITPSARDWKDGNSILRGKENGSLGQQSIGLIARTGKSDRLNPEFCRWLMGYPEGWTLSRDTEIRSCRNLQQSTSKQ